DPTDADVWVRSDGSSYLYLKKLGTSNEKAETLVLNRNGIETPLVTDFDYTIPGRFPIEHFPSAGQPDTTYRITAGRVAYIGQGRLYTIAPNSTAPVPVVSGATSLAALAADGSIAYQTAGGMAIAIPTADGYAIYNVGAFSSAWNIGGTWYVSDGSKLDQ